MKITIKRAVALFLTLCLAGALLLCPVFAANSTTRADALNALGLFKGTGDPADPYQLGKKPDRTQGLVMLLRLLGKEEAVLSGTWSHPFTDVQAWSAPYVGYAYEKNLTSGVSADRFGSTQELRPRDYVTFLLRALGYSDQQGGQFTWSDSLSYAASIGLMDQKSALALESRQIDRGDMVDLSYAALFLPVAGKAKTTLADRLISEGVFTRSAAKKAGVVDGKAWAYSCEAPKASGEAVHRSSKQIATSKGTISASVIEIDLTDPAVRVEAKLVDDKVGVVRSFDKITSASGAKVVINGNFFSPAAAFKAPVGHVISGGKPLYLISGFSTLGIREDGSTTWGRPSLAVWYKDAKTTRKHWIARAVNLAPGYHTEGMSMLYTPAYGTSVTVNCKGYAIEMIGGVVSGYYSYQAGQTISIPADGEVLLLGTALTELYQYRAPAVGTALSSEIILFTDDAEGFDPDGVTAAMAGAPRLVKDGAECHDTDANFDGEKFTSLSTPRTAVGTTADGRLIMVATGSATIQQMREAMLQLGCQDAVNLDGGGSCAMYMDGVILHKPGRELTSTIQVFVDGE